jgi:hypothetical protein
MHGLRGLVVIGALAVVVGVVAAGPAVAAKGGNNDFANLCQHGGWKTLFPVAGGAFATQGDCVNDGAQASSSFSDAHGMLACFAVGSAFFPTSSSWICRYDGAPDHTRLLRLACSDDGGIVFSIEVGPPPQQTALGRCTGDAP